MYYWYKKNLKLKKLNKKLHSKIKYLKAKIMMKKPRKLIVMMKKIT